MRKKCNEQRVIDRVSDGLHLSPIDVEGVRETGEGVEADADWKHDLQHYRRRTYAKQSSERAGEEIVILEEPKYPQVNYQTNDKQKLLTAAACSFQEDSQVIIHDRGSQDEQDESWVPPHVKDIARQQQQDFSEAEWHAVEQRGHDEKEDPILEAVK